MRIRHSAQLMPLSIIADVPAQDGCSILTFEDNMVLTSAHMLAGIALRNLTGSWQKALRLHIKRVAERVGRGRLSADGAQALKLLRTP